ncbi:MAG: LacI family DNA-binding transcriptional regulator [Bacilli bacterium]
MVKISDIAKKCNVSISTVSKALNGRTDLSQQTSSRIRQIAHEMGYIPNANARILKTNRSYNIGVLFVDKTGSGLSHEYFSSILNSLKNEAEANGYDITFISNQVVGNCTTYYEHAKYRGCDGVVIASVDFHDPQVIELVESNIPTVTIDYVFDGHTSIMSDNVVGLHDIVEYLHRMGHRKIAFIHGENTAITQKRLASFYKTCEEYGIDVPDDYVKEGMYHVPKLSGKATRELLALDNPPTCIIYPDDYSSLAGITEIERSGLTVGKDISIVGYDGIKISRFIRPELTTYVQDSEEIGKMATKKIVEMIESPKTSVAEQVYVKGHLQEGKTVKALISE